MSNHFPFRDEPIDEKYIVREFVSFLRLLKLEDVETLVSILNCLCPSPTGVGFNSKENIHIEPYHTTKKGKIIDIVIKSTNIVYAIEVKYWAQPGETQASDYREFLDKSSETKTYPVKKLIFLTPKLVRKDPDIDANPTWVAIKGFLESTMTSNRAGQRLVSEFKQFLEEVGLDDKEPDGRIIEVIQEATKRVFNEVRKHPSAYGEDKYAGYTGFYIRVQGSRDFWCGITHNFPRLVSFCTDNQGALGKYRYSDEIKSQIAINLPENYFIANKGPQMERREWIISFLFHMDEGFCSLGDDDKKAEICKFIKIASENMNHFRIPSMGTC